MNTGTRQRLSAHRSRKAAAKRKEAARRVDGLGNLRVAKARAEHAIRRARSAS